MRRESCVFVLLLLFASNTANALSEYGFLLEPKNLSFSFYTINPKSCSGFLSAKTSLAKNARSDFAFEKARQSIRDLGRAKAFAALQPRILTKATLAAYRQHSINCFSYGQRALREASEAAREGLQIIDSNSQKLEKMIGPDFKGFAGGVVGELGEAKQDIERRNAKGIGFGSEFSKTIPLVNQTQTSQEIAKGVEALVGFEELLEKEIALDDRVLQSVFLLEREYQEANEKNELVKMRVKLLREFLEGESIRGIGENAFHLVGGASGVSAENSLESFEGDLAKAFQNDKIASEKAQQAHSDWEKKEQGFASRAIEKMIEANSMLESSEKLLQGMDERSESLEKNLRQRVEEEKRVAQNMLSQANAFAAAKARVLLQKTLEPARLSTRGDRILFYVSKIVELKQIEEMLGESVSEQALRSRVQSKLEVLKEFVSRASKDIPLETEQMRLKEIEFSVESAQEQENAFFNSQLNELKESVLARLFERYSGVDGAFERAYALTPFFGEASHARLLELTQFFPFGKIDLEKAAGNLADIERVLNNLLASAEAKTPEILKKHLQEQAVIGRTADLPTAGEKTRVRTSISLKNLLPLSLERRLQLDFEIPENAIILAKSPEVSIAKNVFLEKVGENAEYFVEYETMEEIARIERASSKAIYADLLHAEVEENIVFGSSEETQVLLVLEKPFPIEFAQANEGRTVFFTGGNSSQVRILAHAYKGANQLVLSFTVPQPVHLQKNYRIKGNQTEIELSVESKYFDLPDFNDEIAVEGCDGRVSVAGELDAKVQQNQGGVLLVEISERELKRFEKKSALVVLDCIAFSQENGGNGEGGFQKNFDFAEAEELGREISELEKECEECVVEAKKMLLLGDLEKAREEVEKAKSLVLQKREKNSAEKQAFETSFTDFEALRERAFQAMDDFDNVFFPTEENAKEVSKSLLFQQGKKAKAEIEKLLKDGEKAKTSLYLNALLDRIESRMQALEDAVEEQKQNAQEEITIAELKQRQFGSEETLSVLKEAKEYGEKGNAFTAWAVARRLNAILDSSGEKQRKESDNALLLGGAGALVLIALAFFFLRNKNAQFQEV